MLPQVMPPTGQRSKRPIFPQFQNQAAPPKPGGSYGGPAPMSPGTMPQTFQKPGMGSFGGPAPASATMEATRTPGVMPPTQGFSNQAGMSLGTPPGGGPELATMAGSAPSGSPYRPVIPPQQRTLGADNVGAPGTMPPQGPPQGGGNVNPAWMPQGGVSPFDASSGSTGIGDFQRFSDAAYERQAGRLTPQFEAQERSFEQQMVNRGIAPGTPAYDDARQNFENSRNDAFEGARTQADQLGAALQQQSFSQGATNSQGLRDLILGQLGADTARFGATTSANASMSNANTAAQSAADRLRYDQQQGDFGNLMQLLGFGMGATNQNNAAQGQNYNQNAGMLGMIPGMQQPGNIDVTSGYNNQYNAGLNQAQWQQQQNNANNQNYAQWAALLASMYGG